jgi:glycosyltransferase involved in cell wall biosynthesis
MNILLVGNYAADRQQSMQRYANMLADELKKRGDEARVIRPTRRLLPEGWSSQRGLGKWIGYIDKFVLFPAELRRLARSADVVHICDHSNAMYIEAVRKRPHVVTCHDVLTIQSALAISTATRVSATGKLLQRWILRGLNRAQYVVCVSRLTQRDLLQLSSLVPQRMRVIHQALNYPYRKMPEADARNRIQALGLQADAHFFIHVGANMQRKNRLGVIEMYAAVVRKTGDIDTSLVFVGEPLDDACTACAVALGVARRITVLEDVDNEDLCALYSVARALIFPSFYEGFGWPIIEAQACGCPVFTSNREPMMEVGGVGAVYVDPEDAEAAADVIAAHLPRADDMIACGTHNVAQFTSDAMIDAYLNTYASLLPRARSATLAVRAKHDSIEEFRP